jgi:ABC-type Fe3+-siderophore transport system permease subunit
MILGAVAILLPATGSAFTPTPAFALAGLAFICILYNAWRNGIGATRLSLIFMLFGGIMSIIPAIQMGAPGPHDLLIEKIMQIVPGGLFCLSAYISLMLAVLTDKDMEEPDSSQ